MAQIIVNTFPFALPLYRQDALFAGLDIPFSQHTQSQGLLQVADHLKPLRGLMHEALLVLVLYDDQDTRSGRCSAECLAGYIGYLQVDGDAGYHSTEAKLVGCRAHARRKFEEARWAQPNAHVGKVVWALSLTQKLYRIEKACQDCPPEDVYR